VPSTTNVPHPQSSSPFFDLAHGDRDPAAALRGDGVALLSPERLVLVTGVAFDDLEALRAAWDRLPADRYLRDGGAYRHRRHASYVQPLDGALALAAHRPHWQPTSYNALHGGIERWFEPVEAEVDANAAWRGLIAGLGTVFAQAAPMPVARWFVEAHQFRIDTAAGIGRPTPEGAHRDGVDFVAVILVARHDVRGGETRVFEADGPRGVRFTLDAPWSALLIDDARVIHETTPIQPAATAGWRDTLVLTYRRGGFLEPGAV